MLGKKLRTRHIVVLVQHHGGAAFVFDVFSCQMVIGVCGHGLAFNGLFVYLLLTNSVNRCAGFAVNL